MRLQRSIATVLVVGSSALAAWVLQDLAYPAVLCLLGLLGLSRRVLWTVHPNRRIITSLLMMALAIAFTIHYRLAVTSRTGMFLPTAVDAWQTVTRFFLAAMIVVLYLGERGTLPPSFAFFQIGLTLAAGQILLLDDRTATFRILEAASVAGATLYMISHRPAGPAQQPPASWRSYRVPALGLALFLTLNGGWVLGSVLYQHQGTINALGTWVWGESSGPAQLASQVGEVGFSTSGRLSSLLTIIEKPDTTPILKVSYDRAPGYLRACAFEGYRQSQWYDRSFQQVLNANVADVAGQILPGGQRRFQLSQADVTDCPAMTIAHKTDLGDAIFTRLGTVAVEAPSRTVFVRGDDAILRVRNATEGITYKVIFSTSPDRTAPEPTQRRRMLAFPQDLDPRINNLASQIFAGCQTTADKSEAVVRHFRTRYSYVLGLEIPPNQDPLTYFLLESSTGYCEYFASGAALLLRMANVPTRYVTGLLVTERDPLDAVWIARNSHAHAWVEAWDDEQGCWSIVEATVSQGADANSGAGEDNAGERSGWLAYQEFLRATYAYGLFGPVAWAVQYHPIWAAGLSLLGAAGLAVLWIRLHRAKPSTTDCRPTDLQSDPVYQTIWRLLARMDRRLRRRGLVRGPSETLVAFAIRVEQCAPADDRHVWAAQWYRQYSDLRYRPSLSLEDVQTLRQAVRG